MIGSEWLGAAFVVRPKLQDMPSAVQVVVWTLVRRDSAIYGALNKNDK